LLLINPWIYDFTAYDFWSKPLGLLYIASILRKSGYLVDFIDCTDRYDKELLKLQNLSSPANKKNGSGSFFKTKVDKPAMLEHIPRNYSRYGITEDIFCEKLKHAEKPDAILVTSIMTYWYPGVFRIIELVKEYFPGCPVILGGIYATLCYEHAVQFSRADIVLKNYQLPFLFKILADISSSPVAFEIVNPVNNNICLKKFPYPAWDLYEKLDYICLFTGQGCPFQCSYCASHLISPEMDFRHPSHVFEEIEYLNYKTGVNRFIFYDDALLYNPESRFIPLMKMIKKSNMSISFYTPNAVHANLITSTVAELMKENRFEGIWLGFETSDDKLQKETGGKINNSGFRKAVQNLLKAGFSNEQIRAYVLIGLPGQSYNSILNSIHFVMDTGIKPYLTKYSPIPGTKIWSEAIKNFKLTEPVDPLWHNDALMPYNSPDIDEQKYQQLKNIIQKYKSE